jgi:predicted nucleic acid-binding protein
MNFVLDNSVAMRWFFGDGKPQELVYAGNVLDAMKDTSALVPVTWGLEVSNVIARAEAKGLVTEARSEAFLELLQGVDIQVDAAIFSHALSGTLQLARRYRLSA